MRQPFGLATAPFGEKLIGFPVDARRKGERRGRIIWDDAGHRRNSEPAAVESLDTRDEHWRALVWAVPA